ncbi:hypothetical protein E6C27_scaffold89G005600 [Cucumis melo var. makuwa]|uniref:Uncharacterized protein n=1 Tax=Cucumis melo var. makuwa TaxID=1194695 RepID=A0A5A7V6X6_CUCMM|nr:hypothetical protein E6C27_scaffold89G005600 [Cucumis melo var. makuwa]
MGLSTLHARRFFEILRVICASFLEHRLICVSFGSSDRYVHPFGAPTDMCVLRKHRVICASFGSTRLMCVGYPSIVRVWQGADRRGARRMHEGHMDASGLLYASADAKNKLGGSNGLARKKNWLSGSARLESRRGAAWLQQTREAAQLGRTLCRHGLATAPDLTFVDGSERQTRDRGGKDEDPPMLDRSMNDWRLDKKGKDANEVERDWLPGRWRQAATDW